MRSIKTISIQPGLLKDMLAFDENWSAVACRAFKRRLLDLKRQAYSASHRVKLTRRAPHHNVVV